MKRQFFFGLVAIVVWITFPLAEANQQAVSYVNLGLSYYKLGKHEDAVKQFQKALDLNSDFQNLYGLLGTAFFQLGLLPYVLPLRRSLPLWLAVLTLRTLTLYIFSTAFFIWTLLAFLFTSKE